MLRPQEISNNPEVVRRLGVIAINTALEVDTTATKFTDITYAEVLARNLKVMDLSAICMCQDNNLPIYVFNMDIVGNLRRVMEGEDIGTLVHQ